MTKELSAINKKFINFYDLCRDDESILSVLDAAKQAGETYANLKKWFKLTYIINMSRNYYNMHKFTKFRIKFIEI